MIILLDSLYYLIGAVVGWDSLYYLIGSVIGWALAVLLFCLLKYLYGAD
jgi:hypothetical protein